MLSRRKIHSKVRETEVVPVYLNNKFNGLYRFVEPIDEFAMQADWSDRTYARSMLSFHVGTFAVRSDSQLGEI